MAMAITYMSMSVQPESHKTQHIDDATASGSLVPRPNMFGLHHKLPATLSQTVYTNTGRYKTSHQGHWTNMYIMQLLMLFIRQREPRW